MNRVSLSAIILTFNEEIHLQRCIDSLKNVCEDIIIVDSFSKDKTKDIALKNNARFVQNKWINHAIQFNWALENCDIKKDWILRLDADEYLTPALQDEIIEKLNLIDLSVTGIMLPLQRIFMNRHLKKGYDEIKLLRIFRNGKGKSENRWMDEHISLSEGLTIEFSNSLADHNLNSLHWWTTKHNGYSIREAIDLLDIELGIVTHKKEISKISAQAAKKRKLKKNYAHKPLFLRAFIYFIYRYFFRLGFTEGKEGFLWHFLQGWWYRTLVDAKIYEIKKACGNDKEKIKDYIQKQYQIVI
ncbi:glycosyltransferase family 2 protein [Gramella sp. AN32]|uniref:Glycosyltransferase family 2 protein n=1 Tax=Christiangramia antarctica TaxID=2058158 RepID=A0ABW5X9A3_9FLAO|nr:glycosyltransferase family 2 protein [Gramella sp. AN32]MCM4155364.1 glycosyltransferase family 2 protein [Gramella sp. AN32]